MSRPLRILTFAGHPDWLAAAAAIGHRWDVVQPAAAGLGEWWTAAHALPANARPVRATHAAVGLSRGSYDAVVCHDPTDRLWVGATRSPVVSVFHVPEPLAALFGDGREEVARRATGPLRDAARVFASRNIRTGWGDAGEIIPPGIPVDDRAWEGRTARPLIVGDFLELLAPINGSTLLDAVLEGLPVTVLGLNPGTRERAPSPDEIREAMRTHRLLLHVSVTPFQPGISMPMLHAMAAGLPVVTMAHPESPITDGVDGFLAPDPAALRARVMTLLADHDLAARVGTAGRATVRHRFPLDAFQHRWRTLLEEVTGQADRQVA